MRYGVGMETERAVVTNSASSSSPALLGALRRYVEARNTALTSARIALKVNELDARALLYIARNKGTRPGNLRDYLGITSAGVTTLIDRLVEREAVRRDVDADDRRVNRISVTVDLDAEPWSALTQFDAAFAAALEQSGFDESGQLGSCSGCTHGVGDRPGAQPVLTGAGGPYAVSWPTNASDFSGETSRCGEQGQFVRQIPDTLGADGDR